MILSGHWKKYYTSYPTTLVTKDGSGLFAGDTLLPHNHENRLEHSRGNFENTYENQALELISIIKSD